MIGGETIQGVVMVSLLFFHPPSLTYRIELTINTKMKQITQDKLNALVFPHANLPGDGEKFQIKM